MASGEAWLPATSSAGLGWGELGGGSRVPLRSLKCMAFESAGSPLT